MSYRDPKIIVDRSAEIYAQGANQLGKTMGKFVDDTFKIKLEETGIRIKQVNAIGQWAQTERDKSDIVIAKNATKVAPGLSEQYIDMQTKDYNELIKRSVKAKIDPTSTSREERDWIQKQSIRLKTDGAVIEKFRVQNELNLQEVAENVSDGTDSPDTVWNNIEGRLAFGALNNKLNDGITHEKAWSRGSEGQLLYDIKSTIDYNTPLGKSIIEAWELPFDKETGLATIKQTGDPANLTSPLTDVPPGLVIEETNVIGMMEKGKLGKNAFFEHSTFTDKESGDKTVTSRNGIFDEVNFMGGVYDEMSSEAYSIVQGNSQGNSTKVQLAYINSRIPLDNGKGGLMTEDVWESKYDTVEKKAGYITKALVKKHVDFAKKQLRSRPVTDQDIKDGMPGDADGLIWYDPTVAKIVDTNTGNNTPQFSAEAAFNKIIDDPQNSLDINDIDGKYNKNTNVFTYIDYVTEISTDAKGKQQDKTVKKERTYDLSSQKGMQKFINLVVNESDNFLGQANGPKRDAIKNYVREYFDDLNPNKD